MMYMFEFKTFILLLQMQTGAPGTHQLRNTLRSVKAVLRGLNLVPFRTRREVKTGTRTVTRMMRIFKTVSSWAHHTGFNKSASVVLGRSRGGVTVG
jgi:hypothetical protein